MTLTPEQLEVIPIRLINLYQELEDFILKDFSRRLLKAGEITDTAKWQAIRGNEIGLSIESIKKEIKRVTKLTDKEIEELLYNAGLQSLDHDNKIYSKAGLKELNVKDNPFIEEYIKSAIIQTKGELINFTQSMGFADTVGGKVVYKPIAKYYHDALDFAQLQISNGVTDYNTAVKTAIKKLSQSGLRYVDFESGWSNRIDVAVKRATLTGANQLAQNITISGMEELGCEYVETTAHAGARPSHAQWQGKVFCFKGKDSKYQSLEEATGYGTGEGLCGWNCRHLFNPFFPGISVPAYSKDQLDNIDNPPFEFRGKEYTHYEATQYQRRIETSIRQSKRELIMFKEAGLNDEFTNASIKMQRQKSLYKEFSKKAGLPLQNERYQVLGFDRSISQKAVWANKHEVEKYKKINYNKDKTIIVTDDWKDKKHVKIPKDYKPNAVIETKEIKGNEVQINRTIYDSEGRMSKQIHTGPHKNPKLHPYGEKGEHKHIYTWEGDKVIKRTTEELSNLERKEHRDIL